MATNAEIINWIRKFERRYQRRPMDAEGAADWCEALSHIPSSAWHEICQSWWWNERQFPTPGELDSCWRQWYAKHPDKHAQEDYVTVPCSDCLGKGYLIAVRLTQAQWQWLRCVEPSSERHVQVRLIDRYVRCTQQEQEQGYGYDRAFVCASCDNWTRTGHSLWWWADEGRTKKLWLTQSTRRDLESKSWFVLYPKLSLEGGKRCESS